MYFVYVLKDENGNLYEGQTENLEARLKQHNSGKTKTTSKSRSWEVTYFETFENRIEAVNREKYFKTAAGRRFLKTKLVP